MMGQFDTIKMSQKPLRGLTLIGTRPENTADFYCTAKNRLEMCSFRRRYNECSDYKISAPRGFARGWFRFMSYYIYILQCSDKSLYVGCTNNLERRLKQHNDSKKGAHYTKTRRPVILKYQETFKTLREGRRREAEIKRWPRKKKLNLFQVINHEDKIHPR